MQIVTNAKVTSSPTMPNADPIDYDTAVVFY